MSRIRHFYLGLLVAGVLASIANLASISAMSTQSERSSVSAGTPLELSNSGVDEFGSACSFIAPGCLNDDGVPSILAVQAMSAEQGGGFRRSVGALEFVLSAAAGTAELSGSDELNAMGSRRVGAEYEFSDEEVSVIAVLRRKARSATFAPQAIDKAAFLHWRDSILSRQVEVVRRAEDLGLEVFWRSAVANAIGVRGPRSLMGRLSEIDEVQSIDHGVAITVASPDGELVRKAIGLQSLLQGGYDGALAAAYDDAVPLGFPWVPDADRVKIAIIDVGIDSTAPPFVSEPRTSATFCEWNQCQAQAHLLTTVGGNQHGTVVANIAGGGLTNPADDYKEGMAPRSFLALIGFQPEAIYNSFPGTVQTDCESPLPDASSRRVRNTQRIVNALENALEQEADIVNLSVVNDQCDEGCDPDALNAIDAAIAELGMNGVLVVKAAGNYPNYLGGQSPPGECHVDRMAASPFAFVVGSSLQASDMVNENGQPSLWNDLDYPDKDHVNSDNFPARVLPGNDGDDDDDACHSAPVCNDIQFGDDGAQISGFSLRGGAEFKGGVRSIVSIVAPGCRTFAVERTQNAPGSAWEYRTQGCGTSWAAPVVAGAAADLKAFRFLDFLNTGLGPWSPWQRFNDPAVGYRDQGNHLHASLLSFGDGEREGAGIQRTGFDPRWGAGRLRIPNVLSSSAVFGSGYGRLPTGVNPFGDYSAWTWPINWDGSSNGDTPENFFPLSDDGGLSYLSVVAWWPEPSIENKGAAAADIGVQLLEGPVDVGSGQCAVCQAVGSSGECLGAWANWSVVAEDDSKDTKKRIVLVDRVHNATPHITPSKATRPAHRLSSSMDVATL